ncbi:hypothetical protein GH913_04695 [Xanthomonas citri pv. malvacearum]|nr:hypothetical protein GH913_04695 [Xanthomonas citri pv. malvacearum]
MALQKGQRLREAGQFEVAAVGQIKSAGDIGKGYEKIPLLASANGRGDYHCAFGSWQSVPQR